MTRALRTRRSGRPPRDDGTALRRRVPAPLAALLFCVVVFSAIWSFVMPPAQGPDEGNHMAYIQVLAERNELPNPGADIGRRTGDIRTQASQDVTTARSEVSQEHSSLLLAARLNGLVFLPYTKAEWSRATVERWDATATRRLRDNGGAGLVSGNYPPGAYAVMSVPYKLFSAGNLATRGYAIRFFAGTLWLLVSTIAVWCLAGELFGRRRPLQTVAAATVGLWPMYVFAVTSINPDGMLCAMGSVVLWLGVRILRRSLTWQSGAGLGLAFGLAYLSKPTAVALLPGVLLALGLGAWRLRSATDRPRLLRALPASLLALAALPVAMRLLRPTVAGATVVSVASGSTSVASPPAIISYLWQFYLPRLPGMEPRIAIDPVASSLPVINTWIGMAWGAFAWVNIWFPKWTYGLFAVLTALVICLALRASITRSGDGHRRIAGRLSELLFLAACGFGVLGAVQWVDFTFALSGEPFAQARYLFPVAGLAGLAAAAAVLAVPKRARPAMVLLFLGGVFLMQGASLALVVDRFYA